VKDIPLCWLERAVLCLMSVVADPCSHFVVETATGHMWIELRGSVLAASVVNGGYR
jgi:hypothetical protein